MKKSYLIIAAAAALFAACQDNEIKNDVREFNDSAIAFNSYAGKQTKADNSNKDNHDWLLENHHNGFYVWAWKYYSTAWVGTAVYDKEEVVSTTTNNVQSWATDPVKFWDKSADYYYFYAAAPIDAKWTLNNNNTTSDYGDDYLTYADFVLKGTNLSTASNTDYAPSFKGDGNDVDLMIAEDNKVMRAKYNHSNPEVVTELFDHILSRLNVTVKRGTNLKQANAIVKLTSFTIYGVNLCNKGSFDEHLADNSNTTSPVLKSGTILRWASSSSPSRVDIDDNNGKYNLVGAIPTAAIEETELYIGQYLIIPQAITSEVLDRATPKQNIYYTQEEIDAAANDETAAAHDKTTADIKTPGGGADAAHPYIKIEYTIAMDENDTPEPYTAYYNLANAFGVAAGSTLDFNEGWQNTLKITIDADAIVFDANVYQWADQMPIENGPSGNATIN